MEFSFGYQRVFHWQSVHGEDNEEKKKNTLGIITYMAWMSLPRGTPHKT